MDSVRNLTLVPDALRRQLAENIEQMSKSGKLAKLPGRSDTPSASRADDLETMLRRRIAAIDRGGADGKARAASAFVESVLIAEFGDGLLSDPGFGRLLAEVSESLSQDPQLQAQIDVLLGGY